MKASLTVSMHQCSNDCFAVNKSVVEWLSAYNQPQPRAIRHCRAVRICFKWGAEKRELFTFCVLSEINS